MTRYSDNQQTSCCFVKHYRLNRVFEYTVSFSCTKGLTIRLIDILFYCNKQF